MAGGPAVLRGGRGAQLDVSLLETAAGQASFDRYVDALLQGATLGHAGEQAGRHWIASGDSVAVSGESGDDDDAALRAMTLLQTGAEWDWLDKKISSARQGAAAIVDSASNAFDEAKDAVAEVYDNTKEAVVDTVDKVGDFVDDRVDDVKNIVHAVGNMGSLEDVINKVQDFTLDTFPEEVSVFEVLGAVLFGLFNGFLVGMGDMFRGALAKFNADETCLEHWDGIKTNGKTAFGSFSLVVRGLIDSSVRNGESRISFMKHHLGNAFRSVRDFCGSVWQLVSECPPVRKMLMPIALMIVLGVALTTAMALSPVVGWVLKAVGLIITFIFGVPFLFKTGTKLGGALGACAAGVFNENVSCRKADYLAIIEAIFEFIGFFANVILLSGMEDIVDAAQAPRWAAKMIRSPFMQRLGLKWNNSYFGYLKQFTLVDKATKSGNTARAEAQIATAVAEVPQIGQTLKTTRDTLKASIHHFRRSTTKGSTVKVVRAPDAGMHLGKNGQMVRFDQSVNRWREVATGRFAKAPTARFDTNANRWRDIASGRFTQGPSPASVVKAARTVRADTAGHAAGGGHHAHSTAELLKHGATEALAYTVKGMEAEHYYHVLNSHSSSHGSGSSHGYHASSSGYGHGVHTEQEHGGEHEPLYQAAH